MSKQVLFNRLIRKHIHKAILLYLKRCGGAFHSGEYGKNGVYVMVMSDRAYNEYQGRG